MALKKPICIYSGQLAQIASTDTLDVPGIAAGDVVVLTNDESSPIVIGAPVYMDSADGVKKAKADATGTKNVIGLVKDASITNGTTGGIVNTVLVALFIFAIVALPLTILASFASTVVRFKGSSGD